MKILAITLEKCSGSALMIDGKIIFSSSEERYTRKKSDASFPQNSINQFRLKTIRMKPKQTFRNRMPSIFRNWKR